MRITTTCIGPPEIKTKFNPNLLLISEDVFGYWDIKKRELQRIKKELTKVPYGKKKIEIITKLIQEFEEKYERSKIAKDDYDAKKKATFEKSSI